MRTLIILIFSSFFITAHAQTTIQRPTESEKVKAEVAHAQKQLELSPRQAVQYEKIVIKYNKLEEEIKSLPADSAALRVNKRRELIEKRAAEVKATLTADQYKKYRTWMGLDRYREMGKARLLMDSIEGKK